MTYRTLEDLRTEYEKRIREHETMCNAWKAVTIKTRKNGSEYAAITRACIDGAAINTGYDGCKKLHVGDWSTGYVSDEIAVEKWEGNTLCKMDPQQARDAIEYRAAWHEKQASEQRAALEWLNENAGGIFDKIEKFRDELTEGAPDKKHMQWALGEIAGDLIQFNTDRKYWR